MNKLAEELGLSVCWEHDEYFDGDYGDFISAEEWDKGYSNGRYEVLTAYVQDYSGTMLASLGGVIVDNSLPDAASYKAGFEQELLAEAIETLKRGNV